MVFGTRFAWLAAAVLLAACKPTPGASGPAPAKAPGPEAGALTTPAAPQAAPAPASLPPTPRPRDPSLLWQNDPADIEADFACAQKEVVTAPTGQDPRVAIWRAYDAARKAVVEGVDGPNAEAFADQFTRGQNRAWVLEQFWPRVKAHISKYTMSSKETSFVICRTEERDGRWKAFVKSFSRDKSNPPITVEIEDGVPRISFFTY
jgi:hypothetical protein